MLSHSPFGDDRLTSCLRLIGSADAVLLSGDAVYALQPGTAPFTALQSRQIKLWVLAEDAQARAIEVPDWAEAIDYPAFVELSIHHDKVNSWL
jgi:tRNA 2-thiouridine synthesizing protein B